MFNSQYDTALTSVIALAAVCYIQTFHKPLLTAVAVALFFVDAFRMCLNWAETRAQIKRERRRHMRTEEKHKFMLNGGKWDETSQEQRFDDIIGVGTPKYKRERPHLDEEDNK